MPNHMKQKKFKVYIYIYIYIYIYMLEEVFIEGDVPKMGGEKKE
jgi:hypothetical protein